MTCDFWSDKRLHSYICLTGHYITTDFDSVSTVIAFSSFPHRHYATEISATIQEKLKELNIYDKVTTATTDGASNMKKAFETLPPDLKRLYCKDTEKTSTRSQVVLSGVAHRLHLSVCNGLGLWIRKRGPPSSSLTTSKTTTDGHNSNESDEDFSDDEDSSSTYPGAKRSLNTTDLSEEKTTVDDDKMSIGSDEDHSIDDADVAMDDYDYRYSDIVDNWSEDVFEYFDPMTGEEEQEMIGTVMKKCRSLTKLVNKSSILKTYVNSLKKEF